MTACLVVKDGCDWEGPLADLNLALATPVCLLSWPSDAEQVRHFEQWFICLPDDDVRPLLESAMALQAKVWLLHHMDSRQCERGFQLKPGPLGPPEHYVCVATDVMRCNEDLVLNKVIIEKPFTFQPGGHSAGWLSRLKQYWQRFRHLNDFRLHKFSLATPDGNELTTAASGVALTPHLVGSKLCQTLQAQNMVNDKHLFALIVSPKSLFGLIGFIARHIFAGQISQPEFLGVLRVKQLQLVFERDADYWVDGIQKRGKALAVNIDERRLLRMVEKGSALAATSDRSKAVRKVTGLPTAKESLTALVEKPLPWLRHAATEDFRELYQQLRESAKASTGFMIMMLLSTLLATFGLYANSAPVIIGAMLLAPLMAPIVSLAMAFARQDEGLLVQGTKTLLAGMLVALGCAIALSLFIPMAVITSEISARLTPNLLDMGVAIVSGIAAAYAHARAHVAKGLAGVAIAVALVPPLAVTGIGIGWWSWQVTSGALLLFATNLAGIIFAGAITFGLLGFAPFNRAKRGLTLALFAIVLISVPLAVSFKTMIKEAQAIQVLQNIPVSEGFDIRDVSVSSQEQSMLFELKVASPQRLKSSEVMALKAQLIEQLGYPVVLEVEWIQRY